eukprot:6197567-Pleurochrysis_carterae.AAC.2
MPACNTCVVAPASLYAISHAATALPLLLKHFSNTVALSWMALVEIVACAQFSSSVQLLRQSPLLSFASQAKARETMTRSETAAQFESERTHLHRTA